MYKDHKGTGGGVIMLGKQKCRILKQIRQRIADENDIPYVTRECTFQGECRGTCPRCESELQGAAVQVPGREQERNPISRSLIPRRMNPWISPGRSMMPPITIRMEEKTVHRDPLRRTVRRRAPRRTAHRKMMPGVLQQKMPLRMIRLLSLPERLRTLNACICEAVYP